jgi:RIO kinase 1
LVTKPVSDFEYDDLDKYDAFEEKFDPMKQRDARKHRRPKKAPPNWQVRDREIEDVVDPTVLEAFKTTYQPSKHEGAWLKGSLLTFFEQRMITDVMNVVKGGKEASVYRCEGDISTGEKWLAAKVYRPRMFRILSNDAMYKQGRQILTEEGRVVKTNEHRTMRAIGKKSAFGNQVAHTSWLMYEFTTMRLLHDAGASVPVPHAAGENAILMTYIGDEVMAAPLLSEVRLERDEAHMLFEEVMRNVRLMLDIGYVHGDLSAYNMMYWEGKITIIDFPQVVDVNNNSDAHDILKRDITRVCEYFGRQGVKTDAQRITRDLWERYGEAYRTRLFDMSFDEEGNLLE